MCFFISWGSREIFLKNQEYLIEELSFPIFWMIVIIAYTCTREANTIERIQVIEGSKTFASSIKIIVISEAIQIVRNSFHPE